jgi:hypothetical protein
MYSIWRVTYTFDFSYNSPRRQMERLYILETGWDLAKIKERLESYGYILNHAEYLGDGELIPFVKPNPK